MTPSRHGAAPRLRSRGTAFLLVLSTALVVVLLGDAVIRAGLRSALLLAPWMLLGLWAVYAAGVASSVRIERDGVRVQNLLRRTFAPWGRVKRIDMRWQVELALDDGSTLACFGGPARMRPQRLGPGRALEEVDAAADAVAALRRARNAAPADADAPIRRSWDWPALGALGVIAVWATIAVAVTR